MNATTPHECPKHPAGNRTCYVVHRCRCAECRADAARYERARARRKIYEDTTPGVPSSFVSGDVVRAHLRTLMNAGMGWKRIARAAGVGSSTIYPILYGKYLDQPDHPEHRPPRVRVTRTVADAILAVELDLAGGVLVDQTGTARRVQALIARGWSGSKIAERLGVERSNFTPVMSGSSRVTVATREAVRALYEELWDAAPPEGNHRDRIAATRARRLAEQRGWVPPLAWDDETIDDPDARPDLGEHEFVSLVEQVRELADLGYLLPEIAARLGKDDKALRSYLLTRDAELAARIHVELNGRAAYGEGITVDPRRRKAMPENNQHLAEAVRRWIDSRGLTQSVIAARGGPSTTTLTKVLKGTGTLRPSIFADLDRGLEWGDGRAESEWRGLPAAPEGFDWRSVSDEQLLDEIATRMRRGGSDASTAGPREKIDLDAEASGSDPAPVVDLAGRVHDVGKASPKFGAGGRQNRMS